MGEPLTCRARWAPDGPLTLAEVGWAGSAMTSTARPPDAADRRGASGLPGDRDERGVRRLKASGPRAEQ